MFGIEALQPIVRLAVLVGFVGYTSALLTLADGHRPARPLLASLGVLECALGAVGSHHGASRST
ncbi:MAG: hypothetical protein MZV49_25430 [Rhodopseudomonas palustris]|nr:hypothetical protein [Rhodopseudomonas palustris]